LVHLARAHSKLQLATVDDNEEPFISLSLLIPRKKAVMDDRFDVFLEPLVEELEQYWIALTLQRGRRSI
jgi:hypothetical protein